MSYPLHLKNNGGFRMLKKLVLAIIVIITHSLCEAKNMSTHQATVEINKKMIENKVFYSRFKENSFYIQTHFKKIDPIELYGEVDYIMMDSPKSNTGSAETVSYQIKNGKIVIYGNDGSIERISLISVKPNHWILIGEEDVMGDGKRFNKTGKKIWYLKKPKGYPPLERCKPVDLECNIADK